MEIAKKLGLLASLISSLGLGCPAMKASFQPKAGYTLKTVEGHVENMALIKSEMSLGDYSLLFRSKEYNDVYALYKVKISEGSGQLKSLEIITREARYTMVNSDEDPDIEKVEILTEEWYPTETGREVYYISDIITVLEREDEREYMFERRFFDAGEERDYPSYPYLMRMGDDEKKTFEFFDKLYQENCKRLKVETLNSS